MMRRVDRELRRAYVACARSLVRERADLDALDDAGVDIELPVFSVGLVGALADIHPQTLRQYDRLGLIVPQRTEGGARRYSLRDIARLCQAQRLSQEDSINLSGITRILALAEENRQLRRQIRRMREGTGVFAAATDGEVVELRRSERARLWRREVSVQRAIGMRHADYEALIEAYDPDSVSESKSVVIWAG